MADTDEVNDPGSDVEDGPEDYVQDEEYEVLSEQKLRQIISTGGTTMDLIPAVRLNTEAKPEPKKRVPLFYLGSGEDEIEYSVEVPVSPGVGLRFLQLLSTQGGQVANAWLITKLVGEEAFQALIDYEPLTDAQFNQVIARAMAISAGPRDRQRRPKASTNGGGGRRRSRRSGH